MPESARHRMFPAAPCARRSPLAACVPKTGSTRVASREHSTAVARSIADDPRIVSSCVIAEVVRRRARIVRDRRAGSAKDDSRALEGCREPFRRVGGDGAFIRRLVVRKVVLSDECVRTMCAAGERATRFRNQHIRAQKHRKRALQQRFTPFASHAPIEQLNAYTSIRLQRHGTARSRRAHGGGIGGAPERRANCLFSIRKLLTRARDSNSFCAGVTN